MEEVVMTDLFKGVYKGTRVLVTGHTGFKGSWLIFWLHQMGAEVVGFSREIPTSPNHWELLQTDCPSVMGDISIKSEVTEVIKDHRPQIVFHLAAQSLVRYAYKEPIETYYTNLMGSLNLYESCREHGVAAVVSITTDKVYENIEQDVAYKETDRLGGYDPYSSSKACVEIMSHSYRNSFLNDANGMLLATARAGNVIGGGDWAEDRLIPDLARAFAGGNVASIRNPKSIRPWQHVLEPLSGYLILGQRLLGGDSSVCESWNFGPSSKAKVIFQSRASFTFK